MSPADRPAPRSQNIYAAAAWMAGWLCALSIVAISGRELSAEISTFQTMFFRSMISLALTLAFWLWLGRPSLATRRFGAHFARNVLHYGAQFCWFLALGPLLLPLAQVISIEFTAPAWTALFAAMFLGERLTPSRITAIVLGFVGVLVILRPGVEAVGIESLVVVAAAIGFGIVLALTKTLSGTETALSIVFYMHVTQLIVGAAPALWYWVTPSAGLLPWAAAVGVAGFFSHYCLSRAMTHADATVVMPLDFLRLPIMIVLGYLLYAEQFDLVVVVGASLILMGNLVNVRNESRGGVSARPLPDARGDGRVPD